MVKPAGAVHCAPGLSEYDRAAMVLTAIRSMRGGGTARDVADRVAGMFPDRLTVNVVRHHLCGLQQLRLVESEEVPTTFGIGHWWTAIRIR